MSGVRGRVKPVAAWTTGAVAAAALAAVLGGCSTSAGPDSAAASNPDSAVVASGPSRAVGSGGSGVHGSAGSGKSGSAGRGAANGGSAVAISSADAGAGVLGGAAGTGPGYHDSRITLPGTVSLSFPRVKSTDRTEHEVLSTVQQALRAQLHSAYTAGTAANSSADPLLSLYWSAPALAAAQNEMTAWVKKGRQPVGVLVITGTAYTAPDATGKSVVDYCANWSGQAAEKSGTHATRGTTAAVPVVSTLGTYNTLALMRVDKHHWQVQTLAASKNSANCSSTTTHQ